MKKAVLTVIAACLGCCALAFILPALTGTAVLGAALSTLPFSLETLLCALPVAVLLAAGVWLGLRHRRKCKSTEQCAADKKCGC